MQPTIHSIVKLSTWLRDRLKTREALTILVVTLGLTVGSIGIASAAARVGAPPAPAVDDVRLLSTPAPAEPQDAGPVWVGRDLDGDGAPDFANPTGGEPRGHDRFGDGFFHARRDGGARPHEGVDYDSRAGQDVIAPISGYVARIGYAYPGDERFKYVEIDNPALKVTARVFYVDPEVQVGDSVELGRVIGAAHSLQARYAGITDHIHLEIERSGRKLDAQTLILARRTDGGVMAAMN
jgi:peptidoglycan LD-endopeptidase LytH